MTVTTLKDSGIGKEIKRLSKSAPSSGEFLAKWECHSPLSVIAERDISVMNCYVVSVLLFTAALNKIMYLTKSFPSFYGCSGPGHVVEHR